MHDGWNDEPYYGRERPPRIRRATEVGDGAEPPKKKGCCAMAAAGHAARRGKYRLARRYVAMSVRLIAARVA